MIRFGSGVSAASSARVAAREAAMQARAALGDAEVKLAVIFVSVSCEDFAAAARAVRDVVGDAQLVGGTAGACVFGSDSTSRRGVSVTLLGGDDIEVLSRAAPIKSHSLVETVPAAASIARAADAAARRGLSHYTCLVFGPGVVVDGEALVAAVRKGCGARALLAGALTGDDLTLDRAQVLFGDELHDDLVVVTGLFTRHPIGIAARHGYSGVGPLRTVTRAEGIHLLELDGRRALDVWLEDARAAGADPPRDEKDLTLYLANYYQLGIADASLSRIAVADDKELIARAPFAIRGDGAVQLSATISEGTRVCIMHASRKDMLRASSEAATTAVARAGGRAAGALVLACTGRLAALGDQFPEEPATVARRVGAPIGGACVYGEIARNVRDHDAFYNTTVVIVAFGC